MQYTKAYICQIMHIQFFTLRVWEDRKHSNGEHPKFRTSVKPMDLAQQCYEFPMNHSNLRPSFSGILTESKKWTEDACGDRRTTKHQKRKTKQKHKPRQVEFLVEIIVQHVETKGQHILQKCKNLQRNIERTCFLYLIWFWCFWKPLEAIFEEDKGFKNGLDLVRI